jgi:hypothetical protein
MFIHNNTLYDVCLAVDNEGGSYSYNNIGYLSQGVQCGNTTFEYGATGYGSGSSDYNFWKNAQGPEVLWYGSTYSFSSFQQLQTGNEVHSISHEAGPGLPTMQYNNTCPIVQGNTAADYYPRPNWPNALNDILNGCMPEFSAVAGSSVVDGGTFYSGGAGIYDGTRPDMGAMEYELPPPDPSGVSGTRLTNPNGIQLNWDNYVVAGNKDHGQWKFNLKNYILSKTGGAHTIPVDRLQNEFIDYSADPDTSYTYQVYTVDFQGNQSCNMVEITCDPTCTTETVANCNGGPNCTSVWGSNCQ